MKGEEFDGLAPILADAEQHLPSEKTGVPSTIKLLVAHGVGPHHSGHSIPLVEELVRRLDLGEEKSVTRISILPDTEPVEQPTKSPRFIQVGSRVETSSSSEALGELRISRHESKDTLRSVQVYELTWSNVMRDEELQAGFEDPTKYLGDPANEQWIVKFRDRAVDTFAYLGVRNKEIIDTVEQSVCWMFQKDLPEQGGASDEHRCYIDDTSQYRNVSEEHYAFITHSLGSDILIQTFEKMGHKYVEELARKRVGSTARTGRAAIGDQLRDKNITVFMLSNQLPLLQLARVEAEHERMDQAQYDCDSDSPASWDSAEDGRWLRRLSLAAFSDPNDFLSYGITPDFVERHIDPRLCPRVTNVFTNVTDEISLFGFVTFANPIEAHRGYYADERTLSLITEGARREGGEGAPLPQCNWAPIGTDGN